MSLDDLPESICANYEVHEWKHACAILKVDYPNEFQDIVDVLSDFKLLRSEVQAPGGGKSKVASRLDRAFYTRQWIEKSFDTAVTVDQVTMASPTHGVDCFKNHVALEVEWSNKDPFYDRDLNNFRLLFDLRAISVGVIVTKSEGLKETFKSILVSENPKRTLYTKFSSSTTWMSKLIPRIEGGGGGGCPLLVLGITPKLWVED